MRRLGSITPSKVREKLKHTASGKETRSGGKKRQTYEERGPESQNGMGGTERFGDVQEKKPSSKKLGYLSKAEKADSTCGRTGGCNDNKGPSTEISIGGLRKPRKGAGVRKKVARINKKKGGGIIEWKTGEHPAPWEENHTKGKERERRSNRSTPQKRSFKTAAITSSRKRIDIYRVNIT